MDQCARLLTIALLATANAGAFAQYPRLVLGQKVFDSDCRSCHQSGKPKNDAPQISEQGEWKERLGKGRTELYKNSIGGFSGYFAMPPRGGNPKLTDDEVRAAVDYLLNQAGLH